jgi:very-long-chain (3R)-3-hydroxyacyl-CoA dehydratase
MSTNHQPQSHASSPGIKRIYLLIYNAVCAALWLRILVTVIFTLVSSPDVSAVYTSVEPWARFTQTLAVAEINHAARGTVFHLPT